MKKTLICILLFFQMGLIYGQSEPFAKIGTTWYYGCGDEGTDPYYSYFLGCNCNDTVEINGKRYSLINTLGYAPSDYQTEAKYYLRKEDRKIYYLWKGNDYLFFDFNKNLNDTFELDVREYVNQTNHKIDTVYKAKVYISRIDSIRNSKGIEEYYKIYYVSSKSGHISSCVSENFIKIKGHSNHNFISLVEYPSIPEYLWNLRCFVETGRINYKSVKFANSLKDGDCMYSGPLPLNVGLGEEKFNTTIKIGPNPISKDLEIRLEKPELSNIELSLLNSLGQTVKKASINHGDIDFIWDCTNLDPGFYYLKLSKESFQIQSFKLIKQ